MSREENRSQLVMDTGPRVLEAVFRVLTHRRLVLIVSLIGMVLALQALWRGWGFEDDVLQRPTLLSAPLSDVIRSLYTFLDPSTNQRMMELGAMPWWSLDTVRIIFFRPVPALFVWLDYQLWPDSVVLMHAHSVLWYGGLCALAALLYRRFGGRTVPTGLASVLFALSIGHVHAVVSVAGRGLIQAAFFGLLAVIFHDRWRRDGWTWGAALASVCVVISVMAGEAGVGVVAYLAAYAVTIDRASWPKRIATVLPYAVLVLGWRLATSMMGYGAWGSGFYIDPGREPLRFLGAAFEYSPVLLLSQWLLPDPGMYSTLSVWARRFFWIGGVALTLVLGKALVPILRRSRTARFWCIGMLLAIVPVCATTLPSGRHLLFIGLGAFPLMAELVHTWLSRPALTARARTFRVAAAGLLALHMAIYPVTVSMGRMLGEPMYDDVIDIGLLPGAENKEVVLLTMSSPGHAIYIYPNREFKGQTLPERIRVLAPAYQDLGVTRVNEYTLELKPEYGFLLPPGQPVGTLRDVWPLLHPAFATQHGDVFFRDSAFPVPADYEVELAGMHVTVAAFMDDGRPDSVLVEFSVPLEDESLVWLCWDWSDYSYMQFDLPAVGETLVVPGPF